MRPGVAFMLALLRNASGQQQYWANPFGTIHKAEEEARLKAELAVEREKKRLKCECDACQNDHKACLMSF